MSCHPQCQARVILVCNVFALVLGITVFGLSVGTVRNEVFKLGIWAYLKPLWDMACADIAAGVFICTASVLGCFTMAYRTYWLHLINISVLVFLFAYTLCVGIATLVIADEKNEGLEQLTILICLSTWGHSAGGGNPSVNAAAQPKIGATNAALDVVNHIAATQIGPDSRAPFGMDVFKMNPVPKTFDDCNYFNDLMTPCGALLIVIAIVYVIIMGLAVSLSISDTKNQVESKPRNHLAGSAVAMNAV